MPKNRSLPATPAALRKLLEEGLDPNLLILSVITALGDTCRVLMSVVDSNTIIKESKWQVSALTQTIENAEVSLKADLLNQGILVPSTEGGTLAYAVEELLERLSRQERERERSGGENAAGRDEG